jgi:hypothetical protein
MGLVGLLPDGRHYVEEVAGSRDAFLALCEECGTHFDNDDPSCTLKQGLGLHRGGSGHAKFSYFRLNVLATGETLWAS